MACLSQLCKAVLSLRLYACFAFLPSSGPVSAVLSSHLILAISSNNLRGYDYFFHDVGILSRSHMHINGLTLPGACIGWLVGWLVYIPPITTHLVLSHEFRNPFTYPFTTPQ